ncbi:MAG: STAS domain-containing protein [Planctomycetes bacterium]|nr:STAS domain-containing protein [Planctomycetota bacterium]
MSTGSDDQLSTRVEHVGGAAVVRLRGSAGMREADLLGRELDQLMARPGKLLLLDMTELEFICSAGLGVLIRARGELRARGGRMMLAGLRPLVARLLETTRLTRLFEIYPTVDAALERLEQAGADD